MMIPKSVEEWESYVMSLNEEDTFEYAKAINTLPFVRGLREEGLSMAEIKSIFECFACQLKKHELSLPTIGVYNYQNLWDLMDKEKRQVMVSAPYKENSRIQRAQGLDEIEQALLELDLETQPESN
jgi:DNA-binding transcriptional MerR regulator